jgi:hypothetical protein
MYVDEFSDLIYLPGYSDPLAIIIKFHRGLNTSTQDWIVKSGTTTQMAGTRQRAISI